MTKLKRGKYGRRVRGFSGMAGIATTAEHTTGEHKRLFVERKERQSRRKSDRRQREIQQRGYA